MAAGRELASQRKAKREIWRGQGHEAYPRQFPGRESVSEVRWDADVTNAEGTSVAKYDVLTLVAKTWPPAES